MTKRQGNSYRPWAIIAMILFIPGLFLLAHAREKVIKNGFDLANSLIDPAEIISGGVPRDGIPAITKPVFISAEAQHFLSDSDRIIGVAIGNTAKAYPIMILNWHEIVNDRIGDTRYIVTYCPLCGSGIVFRLPATGKSPLFFGVSGLLYNSDVLLYDLQSESLWSQLLGKAISGKHRGEKLQMIPAAQTTWADWRKKHPDTKVLSTETGYLRNYTHAPYHGYANVSDQTKAFYPPPKNTTNLPLSFIHTGAPHENPSQQRPMAGTG